MFFFLSCHCVTFLKNKAYKQSFILLFSVFQEQEENKSATSWPEYYIDQLNSMAAVSNNFIFYFRI